MERTWLQSSTWLFATVMACSESPQFAGWSGTTQSIEVVNWWQKGSAGENSAFEALIQHFRDRGHPSIQVNTDEHDQQRDDTSSRRYVKTRMAEHNPPHSFQTLAGLRLFQWGDAIEPLDGVIPQQAWDQLFELGQTSTSDGRHYCVPIDLQRENSLFYNESIFHRHGIAAPRDNWTWEDFHEVAAAFRESGVTPLALGANEDSGWGVRILFQAVMFSALGAEESLYENFLQGKTLPSDEILGGILDAFLRVVDATDSGAVALDWKAAVKLLEKGGAAMLIQGDWAASELSSEGIREVASPGTKGGFLYSSDCFPLPRGLSSDDRALAIEFLNTVLDADTQYAFNSLKGSIPAMLAARPPDHSFARDRMQAANAARDRKRFMPGFTGLMTDVMEKSLFEPLLLGVYTDYATSDRSESAKTAVKEGALHRIKTIFPGFTTTLR